MGSRMETFEQIRRDRDREGLSIRALAARHGVHRRAVRQALASPVPPAKRSPVGRPAPKLGAHRAVIDEWIEADRDAPRKQRHTARRIWQRLVAEHGAQVSERQVARYVRERRRELGDVGEAFVPQAHAPGAEGEVDWGEAWVLLGGARTKVHLLHLRLCHSGAAFAAAFLNETQQAFLEAHAEAFEFLGGVPALVRYDNLGSAVKQVLRGRRRVESDRFVAMRSHFLFESSFTLVGLQGAREGRRRGRGRPLPPAPSRPGSRGRVVGRAQREAARRLRGRSRSADHRASRHGRRGTGTRAAVAARAARRARTDRRADHAARRRQGAGDGPPEPLLGSGRPGRVARDRDDRRPRDHDQPRGPGGRASRPAGRAVRDQRAARSLPGAARPQAGRADRLGGAGPAARARRLARVLRRAVGGADQALRALGGRPPDGRRSDALPRARPRAGPSWRSAARWRPARTTDAPSRSSPAAPSRRRARRRR